MITKDMLIIDVLNAGNQERIAKVLFDSGMHCLHCMLAHGETVAEAAEAHRIDVDELVGKLNAAL